MKLISVCIIATLAVSACSNSRRPDIPVQEPFPPLGIASTTQWLEKREVPIARRTKAADIPTEDLCDIVDDCLSFRDSAQP